MPVEEDRQIAEADLPRERRTDPYLSDKIRLLMKLRSGGISDTRILSVIENMPREAFVPPMFADKAYADTALPIAAGQTISQPLIVALMTQALNLNDRHRVLEIGTGSGYHAAILSRLARRVYTIERHRELTLLAEECFGALRISNITTRLADGLKGWPEAAPFDRILVTAASNHVPAALIEQLGVGGVMIIPVGDRTTEQILLRVERYEEGVSTQHLMNVRFVPLIAGKLPS